MINKLFDFNNSYEICQECKEHCDSDEIEECVYCGHLVCAECREYDEDGDTVCLSCVED